MYLCGCELTIGRGPIHISTRKCKQYVEYVSFVVVCECIYLYVYNNRHKGVCKCIYVHIEVKLGVIINWKSVQKFEKLIKSESDENVFFSFL